MKNLFALIALCAITSFGMSQPHQNYKESSLVITSQNFERFWLYINDQLQNEQATESIAVRGLRPGKYNIRVQTADREMNTRLSLQAGNYNYLIEYTPRGGKIFLKSVNFNILANTSVNYQPYEMPQNGHHSPNPHHPNMPDYSQTPPPPPAPQPDVIVLPAHQFCTPDKFANIKNIISSESFESNKLDIAKQVTSSNILTANQITEIALLFSFEDNKLDYLKFAYDFCFDKQNYYLVNEALTYSSSKEELNKFILSK